MKTKRKLTKIWGVGLTLVLLAMLIGAAIPASAATLGWSVIPTPSAVDDVLQEDTDVDFLVIAPNGTKMFAYDNDVDGGYANATLYTSDDGGVTWRSAGVGGGLPTAIDLVAMAISPDYDNDETVVAATVTDVYRSIDGGETFGKVGSPTLGLGTIQDIAVSPYYMGGSAILMAVSDSLQGGDVQLFTTGSLTWTSLDATAAVAAVGVAQFATTLTVDSTAGFASAGTINIDIAGGTPDVGVTYTGTTPTSFTGIPASGAGAINKVGGHIGGVTVNVIPDALAVAFSPDHLADAQMLAVTSDGVDTRLRVKFGTDAWNAGILHATISNLDPTSATIAFPDDYEWSSNNRVLVGTAGDQSGPTDEDDVYRIHGALPGGTTLDYDLNVNGSNTQAEVNSIAIKGNIAEADVLVSLVGSTSIKRAYDPTTSTITWRSSIKSPTGDATSNPVLIWSPTGDDVYCATNGDGSAFQKSTDGGITWNQMALIDVSDLTSATPALSIADSAVLDANTMFIILADGGDEESLFKTTNGGSTWERIWYQEGLNALYPSPNYAEDETLYATQGDTRIWKTTNGGETFIGLTSPAAVTALGIVDKDTYFTGHAKEVYKSGRWKGGSLAGEQAVSIVITDDGTLYVGTDAGNVQQSTNDAASFDNIGAGAQLGATNDVYVALDPDYASNGIIYAGSDDGIFRWEVGTSPTWELLDTGETATATTTVGADSFSITFITALDTCDIAVTTGAVSVTATGGTAPTITYNALTSTWTVTATLALDMVLVTALATNTSAIITNNSAATITLTPVIDGDGDAVFPLTIPAGLIGAVLLPDTSGISTTTGTALLTTAVVPSADGSLYVANSTAGGGVRRSVSPTAIIPLLNFESVIEDLLSGAQLVDLEVVSGSTTLYAIASGVTSGVFGYPFRVITFEDILAVAPALSGPKDGTATPGTSVDLSWKKIDAPATLYYRYQVSTDGVFANLVADATTRGTGVTVNGLGPGTKYWWRVYVDTGSPLISKKSASWTFTPKLSVTGTTSLTTAPSPGAIDVALRPTFQWASVAGATSYEMELADNPFFANASVKKPLTHTTWTWDTDLEYSSTYYWRVRAVKSGRGILTNYSSWSEATFQTMDKPAPPVAPSAPPQITVQPAPPAPPAQVTIPPAPPSAVTPAVIWAIIIIGAVLVIAVIVLIVRTRRVP
ncbi:hypothetical protein ES707_21663 [subsurface metagenome]